MKKSTSATLALSAVGGTLLTVGMFICLFPGWNSFRFGIVMGMLGLVILLAMLAVRRRMNRKAPGKWSGKTILIALIGGAGVLTLGTGLCMTVFWAMMMSGIFFGIMGIAILMALIPVCRRIK